MAVLQQWILDIFFALIYSAEPSEKTSLPPAGRLANPLGGKLVGVVAPPAVELHYEICRDHP